MKETTYGSFPAALILQKRVARLDDAKIRMKVSNTLQDFNTGLRFIEDVQDPRYRKRLALLWRNDFLSSVNIDPHIDSYLKNVLSTYYRELLAWTSNKGKGNNT